ncbi:MAG: GldG family protein [Candidatus Aminicenantes bacterium]|nr:GldG family protein [Candidatus Aminicenantes bacterium]
MDTLKKNLNFVGLTLVILGLIALRIWPHRKAAALAAVVLGITALAVYIALNISVLKDTLRRKSFLYSTNLVLIVVLVLAILVLLNSFLSRHNHRFDFTESKVHSLSDQSIQVLRNLEQDVQIKAFFRDGNYGRGKMEDLFKNYVYYSKKVKYEFIDPDKNPGLVKGYNITQDGTTVLEAGANENRITTTTEEDLTNALIKVTRESKKTIYFLEGHGEHSIEQAEDLGFSFAKDELEKLGYMAKKLTLALSETFPQDCSLLVIPGPQKDLLPNELETIEGYLRSGGRVFFMIDPETVSGMMSYLLSFGVKLEDDIIVDTVSRLFGGDYFMPVITEYEIHEITRNFRYATFFPYARSVEAAEPKPEGITLSVLGKTSPNSWSERQLDQKQVTFDKDKDGQGPLSLAVVATVEPKEESDPQTAVGRPADEKPEPPGEQEGPEMKEAEETPAVDTKKEGRLAAFGDSDFASNRYYNLSGNGNFFLNTVNWLTEESDLISIQPRTSSPRTVQFTPSQGRMIFFVSVIILPLLVLVLGISVWLRRRSL